MLLIAAALVGLLVGLASGGSLRGLAKLRIRAWWVAVLAYVAQAVGSDLSGRAAPFVNVAAYAALLGVIWLNRRVPGMLLVGLGSAANALVITANGGRMPVSPTALMLGGAPEKVVSALAAGEKALHCLAGPETRLPWLADVIPLPGRIPGLSGICSVGDLLLAVGFGVIAFYAVRGASRCTRRGEPTGSPPDLG